MRLLISVLIASSALVWPAKSAEPIPHVVVPFDAAWGRDVFLFSPQRCCSHLQSLDGDEQKKPTLNRGRNANAGAGVAATAGEGTERLAGWVTNSRQAGETMIERPWPSPSVRTAEAAGFVPTDPWPVG